MLYLLQNVQLILIISSTGINTGTKHNYSGLIGYKTHSVWRPIPSIPCFTLVCACKSGRCYQNELSNNALQFGL